VWTGTRPFVGSEALANGLLNRHQLRTRFQAILPDVYLPRGHEPSLPERIEAAWLWSGRKATVAGLSAAVLHGAKWIADDAPVELIHTNLRAPPGLVTRRAVLADDEVQIIDGRPVTTSARTAFDLGRRGRLNSAIARLDALTRATGLPIDDVAELAARRHHGTRGLRQLESALELVDAGAESPKETYLRLVLIGGGLPRPRTQVPVYDYGGAAVAYLDMRWPELQVGVEYDGDQHRTDRRQYVRDVRRWELLEELGWLVVRVVAEDHPMDVLRRVRRVIASRQSAVR
jgi:very-short-patch-repair endonuclease